MVRLIFAATGQWRADGRQEEGDYRKETSAGGTVRQQAQAAEDKCGSAMGRKLLVNERREEREDEALRRVDDVGRRICN